MTNSDFHDASHTLVVSDIHLADAEPTHKDNPLWKRFKRRKLFVDKSFALFLEETQRKISELGNQWPIELVLNGDIFDFDSVMQIPDPAPFEVNTLERLRGLSAEEDKSAFKIKIIIEDHHILFDAIRDFILAGNRLIFVIGNHDIELHWPKVQYEIVRQLDLSEEMKNSVRFCEWFYVSNQDTLFEHGNQYDDYCASIDPLHPLIKKGRDITVRLPFGNIAGRYMINGMGLMNPHVDSTYIRPLFGHLVFFFNYLLRTQPLILWDWLWGAVVTLVYSVGDGLLPPMRDPLMVEQRYDDVSDRANVQPRVVRGLRALHVHPAIYKPIQILRELWLDRAILFILMVAACFEFFLILGVSIDVSMWWFLVPFFFLFPIFVFYARSVSSQVGKLQKKLFKIIPMSAQIAQVDRVVHGHTHVEQHTEIHGVEYLNTGTWSPAFHDVECTKPYGLKAFAWIRPKQEGVGREAFLFEWLNPGFKLIEKTTVSGVKKH